MKNTNQYPPAPWKAEMNHGQPCIRAVDRTIVANYADPGDEPELDLLERQARGRIVLCVNALRGCEDPRELRRSLLELARAWRGKNTERVENAQYKVMLLAVQILEGSGIK